MERPALEVADIFRNFGPAWREASRGHVSHAQLKVISAIAACRTAILGGYVARCENDECGHTVIAYQNKASIYALLFKAASETMLTIAADPKHLGAKLGITTVLHTWGSAMTHHPHVHMIVTGGGISPDGSRWISSRPDYLVPVEVLSALFHGRMLGKLIKAHASGGMQFIGAYKNLAKRGAFKAYLAPLWKTDWFVYAKRPFAGPEQVLAYLSRYTHRVAISNSRLISAAS